MNKRERLLKLLDKNAKQDYIPAAFFLHFDAEHRDGQGAIEKHKEFFRATDMDFVKIQIELAWPALIMERPEDWARIPLLTKDFFGPQLEIVGALVDELGSDALVLVTLYSPFMITNDMGGAEQFRRHIDEAPELAKKGMEISTESLLTLVRECVKLG